MLRWVLIFIVIALIAGVLGFSGIAGDAAYIAKILFFIFLVLFVLSLLFGRRIFKQLQGRFGHGLSATRAFLCCDPRRYGCCLATGNKLDGCCDAQYSVAQASRL